MAAEKPTSTSMPTQTPDELTALARRLRTHAGKVRNPAAKAGMGDDMRAAADVIEGIVSLHTAAHPTLDPSSLGIDTLAAAWLAFQAIAETLPDGPQRYALRLAARIATSLSDLRSEVSEVIIKAAGDNLGIVDAVRELRRALEKTAKVDGAPPIAPAAGED